MMGSIVIPTKLTMPDPSSDFLQRIWLPLRYLVNTKTRSELAPQERGGQVRVATTIGAITGVGFAVFNLFTEGMLALGLIELGAVLFLVGPAMVLSRQPQWIGLSETMLLLAAMTIFGALMVLGGVEETGLFWVYTTPFLAFFLKGQQLGWVYSGMFLGTTTVYMVWIGPVLAFSQKYSPVVSSHFLLSLGFYTLVAAAFDYVRDRYDHQLKVAKESAEKASSEALIAKEKVELAYHAKSRFLAAASHDLRQPTHALGLFIARLGQFRMEPEMKQVLQSLEASAMAMQDLLDGFLDYSRLDSGTQQPELRPVYLHTLLLELERTLLPQANAKGLRLRIRPANYWVLTDAVMLQRMVMNLVQNALRYTPRGSVLIACRPVRAGQGISIEVWDSGIGIAKEHQLHVFNEFYQVGNPARDRSQGIGLGLSIVQRSAQLLGYPIELRSAPGCGSRFSFIVPKTPALTEQSQNTRADFITKVTDLSGTSILLVEDDELSREAVRELLGSWGCKVFVAGSAAEAREFMRHPSPDIDVIVSDYRLGEPDNGFTVIADLRQLANRTIPACLISGDTDASLMQAVRESGLTMLYKPVRPAKLRALIRRLIMPPGNQAQLG